MKMLLLDATNVRCDLETFKEYDNKTSLQYIFELTKKNNFDRYVLLQRGCISTVPDCIKNVVVSDFSPAGIIKEILDNARNSDDIVVVDASSPFYDVGFVEQMLDRHTKYMADYTYALGYPTGMTPTIVKRTILQAFIQLVADEKEEHQDYLFFALSKDINSFDIETFLSKIDMRLARLSFGQDDFQKKQLTAKVFDLVKTKSIDEQVEYLATHPECYYSGTYMVGFDISSDNNIQSTFVPQNSFSNTFLDYKNFEKILDWSISEQTQKVTFLFGGLGECLLHKDALQMIKTSLDNSIDVVVETFAVGEIVCKKLQEISSWGDLTKSKLSIVVKLDAYNQQTYDLLHKNGDFASAMNMFDLLKKSNIKVYKSVVRMLENEVEIEQYIRKNEVDQLIIKKHSTYCGRVEDKKVVDLTPFERCPCFHARREIWIDSKGDIHPCEFSQIKLGNIAKDSMAQIFYNQQHFFESNAIGNYDNDCKQCDDYYTFNF